MIHRFAFILLLPIYFGQISVAQPLIRVIKFPDLESYFDRENDTLYVINFWATWCRPCVAELPFFDDAAEKYAEDQVQVLLVSLDFVDEIDGRVAEYIARREPQSPILLLDELNANSWIDKVAAEWTGAIPATIFVNKKQGIREFHQGDYTRQELFKKLEELIHKP